MWTLFFQAILAPCSTNDPSNISMMKQQMMEIGEERKGKSGRRGGRRPSRDSGRVGGTTPLTSLPWGGDQASVMRSSISSSVYLPHGHDGLCLCASSTIAPGCCRRWHCDLAKDVEYVDIHIIRYRIPPTLVCRL